MSAPAGFSLDAVWDAHNKSLMDILGETVAWTPAGGSAVSIRVMRIEPNAFSAVGVLMMLFGSMLASGFTSMPKKNDTCTVGGLVYRIFDVQGPDESNGIYIHLTK